MNRQEIFDKVATHLLKQGKRAERDYDTIQKGCAYRGQENTKCAVGCLIKDEFYSTKLEGKRVGSDGVVEAIEKSLGYKLNDSDIIFLASLQVIHDTKQPEYWKNSLEMFCVQYKLNMVAQ